MLSEEYLQRPLIKGIVYKTDKDEIRVQDDCTVFIQIRNCRKVTLQEVQAHFRQLKQEASASGKVKLKGATKFLPAVRQLYPAYCASCDKIERIFAELTELVRQIERDGIHMGYSDDELLEAAIWKQLKSPDITIATRTIPVFWTTTTAFVNIYATSRGKMRILSHAQFQ